MSKEYFSHDYNARSDPKLARILMKKGTNGIGIYWCIIEMLYEQKGYISLDHIETIAFELHEQCDCIKSILQDFDLFKFIDDKFYSESVLKRIELRQDKSEKTRSAALIRWGNHADAMRLQSESNAIKGKERKGNKSKRNRIKKDFIPPLLEEVKAYFKEEGYTEKSAIKAFNHYALADWFDANGKPVLSWKQKMNTVWFKDENKIKQEAIIPQFSHGSDT